MGNWLGVDFGTSNSAAAFMAGDEVVHVELEEGRETIPTALFFDLYDKKVLSGRPANQALLDGAEGRYMRSLKSVLGTPLMKEQRVLLGRRTDFSEVITEFLRQLKDRAEKFADMPFDHVVAGRPVFFHRVDAERNVQAEQDLQACYHKAGFTEVRFMYEPEAAALESARDYTKGSVGLVVDIGGGTSDFTLFKAKEQGVRIIASNGVRVGGTDFDRQISYDHFMPLLGRGAQLTRRFAEGTIQAPAHIFSELATWEKIPFLYDEKTIQLAKGMERDAVDRPLFTRLVRVLERRLGHDLAFEAERTKIAHNEGSNRSLVDLSLIEPDLQTRLTEEGLENSLSRFGVEIAVAIQETLDAGGIEAQRVEAVVSVGGSSSMKIVTDAIQECLPNVAVQQGDVFTSIVDGLAIASQTS
ncbi:Hsp70 family protein [Parvibaculaceae bacterium PLY_AMNH_Bact1]|nr:Hsp70 family protein [Parvibaculaceae bacterium PLY_AMNH_Bact1]